MVSNAPISAFPIELLVTWYSNPHLTLLHIKNKPKPNNVFNIFVNNCMSPKGSILAVVLGAYKGILPKQKATLIFDSLY